MTQRIEKSKEPNWAPWAFHVVTTPFLAWENFKFLTKLTFLLTISGLLQPSQRKKQYTRVTGTIFMINGVVCGTKWPYKACAPHFIHACAWR